MRDIMDFDSISIHIASPETIRSMSYGEVKKAETINYRTLKPEKDGLFCERIFGTMKELECSCGKYKSQRYKGIVCDRCGVEVSSFKVRRERTGHIELASPVAHIWYYRSVPSRIGTLLNIPANALKSILYFEKYIVIDPGDTDLKERQILDEDDYLDQKERFGLGFTAMTGAEALLTLLQNYDEQELQIEVEMLRDEMSDSKKKNDKKFLKRIELMEDFIQSKNKPEWMMLTVVPVIPPDLRPMVQLDGGRFATSDLNDLYRRVINRNNRLKRLQEIGAPDIIIRNEKRMLQDAVDALLDNTKKKKAIKGTNQRPLKSLSDMLKGKQGRFRQNLLGKRVDYSGRSVIVVGPNLKMHQCGLPVKMALELFKPFVMQKLVAKEIVFNVKRARQMVDDEDPQVFQILEEVVSEHPVLLNRAPTLHRLGIQAFEPVLVDGKAIRLHPLVCKAFNADFDGDQMAVHVPLSLEAQAECWLLMLSAKNLLDPANGKPIVGPSQDMVLGIYYMTRIKKGVKGEGKSFKDVNEVMIAANVGAVHLQAAIKVFMDGKWVDTTPGRIFLNDNMPDGVDFINTPLDAKSIKKLIAKVFKEKGSAITVRMLDAIKDTGYRYAMIFGATIGLEDIIVPPNKQDIVNKAQKIVDEYYQQYKEGSITKEERFNKVTNTWMKAQEELAEALDTTYKSDRDGFNPVYMMADSGARGSATQMRQLSGMRGLMTKPGGELIELPIKSNFKEGLNTIEFYISTNGARKGLADTALRTADAGYMTRRLVDVAQDVITNEVDCGTINGVEMSEIKNGDEVVETLRERIVGRFTVEDVVNPITDELIVKANCLITDDVVDMIEAASIDTVKVRTVLTCECRRGVCVKCYGRNLATNTTTDIGEAVGIIAAQSIGQPGTQLTMRTFHEGGIAKGNVQEGEIKYNDKVLFDDFNGTIVVTDENQNLVSRKSYVYISKVIKEYNIKGCSLKVGNGDKVVTGKELFEDANGNIVKSNELGYAKIKNDNLFITAATQEVEVKPGSQLFKKPGDSIEKNEVLLKFDPFSNPIISEKDGKIKFVDLKYGFTVLEEKSESGNESILRVTDSGSDTLQPRLAILDSNNVEIDSYLLPGGSQLSVKDGQAVKKGAVLAKISKKTAKAADITGGLPRVSELFDARKPKDCAVLAKVSGTVKFKGRVKSKEILIVVDDFGNEYKHTIPSGAYILVRDGDMIRAGEKLSEGNIDPHDVLAIMGENVLQKFLMDEIQAVYRLQGVEINDKHLGVIIRQMMRKVEIQDAGNTHFIIGQRVDKSLFYEENRKTIKEGGQPAVGKSVLLGITKASLAVDSFLSAASFQETTRVLTNASIKGATDKLHGLKENVIIGHLIPDGTGHKDYKYIKLYDKNMEDLDVKISKLMEDRERATREMSLKMSEN